MSEKELADWIIRSGDILRLKLRYEFLTYIVSAKNYINLKEIFTKL
jgi:hypothetical protein